MKKCAKSDEFCRGPGRGQEISIWGQEILNFGSKIQQVALGFFKFWFFVGLGAGVNIFF